MTFLCFSMPCFTWQVSVGHIVPGGAADLDGRLHVNDEIVFVEGQSVVGSSHGHVVQLMSSAAHAGHVTLGIRRHLFGNMPHFTIVGILSQAVTFNLHSTLSRNTLSKTLWQDYDQCCCILCNYCFRPRKDPNYGDGTFVL